MIKRGGYALGQSYAYYRRHGWGRLGATFMWLPAPIIIGLGVLIGLIGGWLL